MLIEKKGQEGVKKKWCVGKKRSDPLKPENPRKSLGLTPGRGGSSKEKPKFNLFNQD